MNEIVIELERPYLVLCASGGFFGVCGYVLAGKASSNERGLIINGLIHLEQDSADVFYAGLACFSFLVVATAIVAIIRLLGRSTFRVVIDDEQVTTPATALLRAPADRIVEYRNVSSVAVRQLGRSTKSVVMQTSLGEILVGGRWLPPAWPAEDVAREIVARLRASRAGSSDGQAG